MNYRDAEHVTRCLRSLERTQSVSFEVIVVDTLTPQFERIGSAFPGLRLMHFEKDLGPAASRNRGAAVAEGKYLVFLDNDTTVNPDSLCNLIRPLELDPTIGAAQPKLMRMKDPRIIDGVGDFIDRRGIGYSLGRDEIDTGQYDDLTEIFSPRTACALVRRSVFAEVGGFDEDFFAEWEDVDLGWRIRLLGHRIVPVACSKVYHFSGAARQQRREALRHLVKNQLAMILKNYSGPSILTNLPPAIAGWIATVLWRLPSGASGQSLEIMRGLLWPLTRFETVWKKRVDLQGKRRVKDSELARLISPPREDLRMVVGQAFVQALETLVRRQPRSVK